MDVIPVIYRDDRLIFVEKPTGMIIHRGYDRDPVTVADIVRDKIVGAQVFALHRLDRGTSGVMGFALDSEMAAKMQAALNHCPATEKEYIALVRGPMKEPYDLDHPVPNKPGGERVPARTLFLPVATTGRWSLVKAYPRTGRLHQIRRHLKHLSLPVVGDTKYGKGEVNRLFRQDYALNRLFLHAHRLTFKHPVSRHLIDVESPIDSHLLGVLEKLFGRPLVSEIEMRETGI
ncbi:pseudouridylate synthase [bacterium]|nr:pseudouridylate synthase [bacterium]